MRRMPILIVCFTMALGALAAEPATNRPAAWAQPIALAGVPNLHKVSDTLYRCAQPSDAGLANITNLGVRTVVNLRTFHSDRAALRTTGLRYEHIFMKTWHPEQEDVVRFLRIATDSNQTPVLVHCQHGADRTGTMSAIYRIAVQGWSEEDALREMTEGGYGFHEVWINLLPWIRNLDMGAIRKEAGIAPMPVGTLRTGDPAPPRP